MNITQYNKIVYPTIGCITTYKELDRTITKIIWANYAVPVYELGNEFRLASVRPNLFYCYVDDIVYKGWRINNHVHDKYDVQFTLENPGIYKVTVR
jgi:hypothetical protein